MTIACTRSQLNRLGSRSIWRFAILFLITAALAFSGERNTSGSLAENVKDSEPDCTHETKPKGSAAFRSLGKVNPLRLLHRLDAAATQLTIRFSSWPAGRPAWQEMPSVPPASDPFGGGAVGEEHAKQMVNYSWRDHDCRHNTPSGRQDSRE